jgi:hypothetical protein
MSRGIATKSLEESFFAWPPIKEGCMCVTATQLAMLVEARLGSQVNVILGWFYVDGIA